MTGKASADDMENEEQAHSTSDIAILVESFPEMINRRRTRSGSYIQQYANIGIKASRKGIEEPPMTYNESIDWCISSQLHLSKRAERLKRADSLLIFF